LGGKLGRVSLPVIFLMVLRFALINPISIIKEYKEIFRKAYIFLRIALVEV
jgi:hypothetical protein